jgi:hypothetical protein
LSHYDAVGSGEEMKRREFIAALSIMSVLPLGALAQKPMPMIGFLSTGRSKPILFG